MQSGHVMREIGQDKPVVGYAFSLFEFAHLLRIRPRIWPKYSPASKLQVDVQLLPTIQSAVWSETEDSSCLLVLLCSNGSLLLWSSCPTGTPVVKQISWFQDPARVIRAFALDPSGSWLACACMDTHVYIVPVGAVVKGNASGSNSSSWSTDDITRLQTNARRGLPSSIVWWHTVDDFHICIVGTEFGEVIFLDVKAGGVVASADVKESITTLELLQDKQHETTALMITSVSGETWQMLLEYKSVRKASFNQTVSPSIAFSMGYEMVGKVAIPLDSVFSSTGNLQERLRPMPVQSISGDLQFSVQYARNQVFIGAHDHRTDVLEVYDMDVEHLPMFVYQLPSCTSEILLTDRLIFTVSYQDHGKALLYVLSSQLAETSLAAPKPHRKTDVSTIQSFVLPLEERVIAMFKRRKYLGRSVHCDSTEFGTQSTSAEHHVMDGAIVVTTSGVYECRLRVCPEELFLDLAIHQADTSTADILAITTGLDVNSLYEKAAEESLIMGKYEHALKLYQLSKCPFSRRVAQFAKHGRVADILGYLRQVLSKHSDVHTAERKQLSNLAFSCFVQQILESAGDEMREDGLHQAFSQFINDNFDYDEYSALELLSNYGLKDFMFGVAKARGLMAETLESLAQKGMFHLSTDLQTKLATRGFTDIISRSSKGAFVKCMDPEDAVGFLLVKPETILSHVQFLLSHLLSLGEDCLVHIARVLDPSRPSFKSLAAKLKSGRRQRTESGSSITSTISIESTVSLAQEESKHPSLTDLIQLFLCTLIVLNHRRKARHLPPRTMLKIVSGGQGNSKENNSRKRGGTVDTLCKPVVLSCGQQHTAVVSTGGDVYTWGKSQKGRLGHGDLIEDEGKSVPFRVEILHMHRVKVLSVACGLEHTLALCSDGVYAWGSSEYGQLGQGDTRKHTRPVYVTELSDKKCTAVACGHHHSLALSADFRVWSWGWGVHGQLGHGGIEDVLLPSHVTSLESSEVTQLAAGYSHSAVLTSQGLVSTFGGGLYGQLGLGTTSKQTAPRVVELLKNKKVYIICCGSFETVAVTEDQQVYSWGRSPNYLRSHMRPESRGRRPPVVGGSSHRLVPVKMDFSFPSQLEQICCGNLHFAALTASGKVYTWGYNDNGQLGNAKRESQVLPSLVQKLSEIEVASISVGAEFSVAMDTGGRVWVWGRADSGQLGLDASAISSAGKKVPQVPVPTLLTSLPLMNLKSSDTSEQSTSAVESSTEFDLDLPNFSSLGSKIEPYGRESLTAALLMLKKHYPAEAMIRHCMDINDYLSASVIYENLDQWSQVARCQLTFLGWCKRSEVNSSKSLDLLESAMDVLQYVTGKYLKSAIHEEGTERHTSWLVKEFLYFWQLHQLPVASLESFFLDHLQPLAYSLSLILIRDPVLYASGGQTGEAASSQFSNTELDTITEDSQPFSELHFSTEFLTKVTDVVTEQVMEEGKGAEYESDLLTYCSSDEQVGQVGMLSEFTTSTSSEIAGVQKRLWQEILDNIKKDVEKQGNIALSMTTAATIAAAAVSQQRESRQNGEAVNHSDADVVVFTCNHHFPRVYFVDVILPEFQHHMSELVIPLANTTKLLLRFYSKPLSGCLPTACPICVYNSVRMEQLTLASNHGVEWSESVRSKAWEI